MSEEMIRKKMVRKVITHLRSDKEWFSKPVELTPEVDGEYNKWLEGITSGTTSALTFVATVANHTFQKVAFPNELLKECVVHLEVWEV